MENHVFIVDMTSTEKLLNTRICIFARKSALELIDMAERSGEE
jgi:hypothetical protein